MQLTSAVPFTLSLLLLFLVTLLQHPTQSNAHNITRILAKHPEFSTFNHYLTLTHLAAEINRRETITVCAVDNAAMSDLISKGLSLYSIRNVLSLHVIVDYFGTKKLHQLKDGTTLSSTMFQATGAAPGNSGYVNITDLSGGKVGFATSDNSGDFNSFYVKAIEEKPYNISVIQISQVLNSDVAEAPTPEPSSLNLTSVIAAKGCKSFSGLLIATGADKTFEENLDGGLTVFCVGDGVIKSFLPKYKNLTDDDKLSLLLYHGVPVYNSMGMLKSNNGEMNTLATDGSNKYDFDVKTDGDKVTLKTKVVTATITGTLVDEDPVAVYKINKVLLPRELFKAAPEEEAAPAPAPEADSKAKDAAAEAPEPATSSDDEGVADDQTAGVDRINGGGLVMVIVGVFSGLVAFL